MPSVQEEQQARFERKFCPPLDSALIAAILHEPGQTVQGAEQTMKLLAGISDDTESDRPSPGADRWSSSGSLTSSQAMGSGLSVSDSSESDVKSTQHLSSDWFSDALEQSRAAASAKRADTLQPAATDLLESAVEVERLLDEWEVAERQQLPALSDSPPMSRTASEASDSSSLHSRLEVTSLSDDSHTEGSEIPVGADASTHLSTSSAVRNKEVATTFLQCAFPTRSHESLASALKICDYDVAGAIEHIMTIIFVEEEEERAAVEAELRGEQSQSSYAFAEGVPATKGKGKGLDLDQLEWKEASSKSARKQRQRADRLQNGYTTRSSPSSGRTSPTWPRKPHRVVNSVHLTDVRQGGSLAPNASAMVRHASADAKSSSPRNGKGALVRYGGANLVNGSDAPLDRFDSESGDAELAVYLDAEEKRQAANRNEQRERDLRPDDAASARTVKDNEWLLTSSILEQLATLLEIDYGRVRATYNTASFNLPVTFARVVERAAQDSGMPDLAALDAAGDAPPGTASILTRSVAEMCGAPLADVETAMRATGGRQDAVLDLINLERTVKDAARIEHLPDILDPLGTVRAQPSTPVPGSALHVHAGPAINTMTQKRSTNGVIPASYVAVPITPAEKVRAGTVDAVAMSALGAPVVSPVAMALGPSTGDVFGVHRTVQDPLTRWRECKEQNEHYLARRNAALQKAASSWRSPTTRRGVPGAAMYYADEARRLEAKARAWDLRAAECLVEDRQRVRAAAASLVRAPVNGSDGASGSAAQYRNVIDLHGLTVHQALSIVKRSLNEWYSRPNSAVTPFRIITGAGNHSRGNVAILRPAVMSMLRREGWRADLDRDSVGSAGTGAGVIIVRGVA